MDTTIKLTTEEFSWLCALLSDINSKTYNVGKAVETAYGTFGQERLAEIYKKHFHGRT
jgi:hypothetical protein